MADFVTTTPFGVMKRAPRAHPQLSPVALRFRGLLVAIDDLIRAEQDLDGYSGQDPAVDLWIRDAEAARAATLQAIETLVARPAFEQADAHLQSVARLFRLVMTSDDPAQVNCIRARTVETERFLLPWGTPLHFRLNQLILAVLDRLERYAALEDPREEDPSGQPGAAEMRPALTP